MNRWAIIMTSAVKKNIIVPDISTFPLHRISYDKIARKVLAANPGKKLQKHEMEDLWDGIMNTIYDFEGTVWERKRNEVMSSMIIGHHELLTIAHVHSFYRWKTTEKSKKRQRFRESVRVGRSATSRIVLTSKSDRR